MCLNVMGIFVCVCVCRCVSLSFSLRAGVEFRVTGILVTLAWGFGCVRSEAKESGSHRTESALSQVTQA